MKAILQQRYGGPDEWTLGELPDPVPAAGEVLVRPAAAALNAADWHVMRGDPLVARLSSPAIFGRRGPRHPVPGHDVAGTVVALGPGASRYAVGDHVLGDVGDRGGAFAELVAVPEVLLAPLPSELTFDGGAALPLAGTTALAVLREVRAGSLLLVGASGGVGTFALQIAAARGVEVTAVCSTRNVAQARELGAAHVVDYTRDDLPAARYDSVVDLAGTRRLGDLRRRTAPDGILVLSGGGVWSGGSVLGPMGVMLAGGVAGLTRRPRVAIPMVRAGAELAELVDLAAAGTVRAAVQRRFAWTDAAEAVRTLEQEHATGKLVLTF